MNEKHILLFDGVCNLCIGVVNFVIKRDAKEKLMFAALQSESGQALLKKYGLSTHDFDSFVFISGEEYYIKSSAGLRVLKELGGVWMLFYALIILPVPIRDFIYDMVAKTRYRIFGKRDTCIIPTPEVKRRFLP
ncbi:MAG: thiol-disulfide oxidoreductase DCC family protein [Bacteroidales bacterium]|nr:thiol-disulfide oxidoreductase DCC family protein [Bacteroidales bacterium]